MRRRPYRIRIAYASHFSQRLCFRSVGIVVLLCCSGCTLTWVSRRPDLRTVWLDINNYRRLSMGFERRHLDPPSIQEVNEYRWLHGPVSSYSSTATTVAETEALSDGEEPGTDFLKKIPVSSEPPGLPVESVQPDGEKIDPPLLHAPASTMPEEKEERVPVEIELSPLESLREPPERSSNEDQWRPKKSNLEGPTALRFLRRSKRMAVQPTGFDSPNAALPGASILFARP